MLGTPAALRRSNRLALVRLLREGALSRARLAAASGLSSVTAGRIVDDLLAGGVLEEDGGEVSAGVGRPGRRLRLSVQGPRFVTIQLGVAHTRLALLPAAPPATDPWAVTFKTPRSAEAWKTALAHAARQLGAADLWRILLSVPGVVDQRQGRVLLCPNLHWAQKADFKQLLGNIWPVPALVVQEIQALALGHLSAEPANRDFLLVDFGQGVGGAAVMDGELYAAPLPLSGELGHSPVSGNDRRCGCGGTGCVETLVSRHGLLQSLREHGGTARNWPALVEHVRRRGIEPWLARSLAAAADTIAGAVNVLGLSHVVITGSLTELSPAVIERIATAVVQRSMWSRLGEMRCVAAPRRRCAGLVTAGLEHVLARDTTQTNGGVNE